MSKELIEAIQSYENYISANGITEEAISAYVLAAETAINQEKDIQYGLKVSGRVKELIEQFVLTFPPTTRCLRIRLKNFKKKLANLIKTICDLKENV